MLYSVIFRYLRWCLYIVDRIFAYNLILLIYLIRPMLGPMNICPMIAKAKMLGLPAEALAKEGCTQYAIDQLGHQPVHHACINIAQRLIRCHPFTSIFR